MRDQDPTYPKQQNPSEEQRALDEQCGDTGEPISEVDPDAIAARSEEFEGLKLRCEALSVEMDEWRGKYARSLADFQNFQRRSIENEREAKRQGVTSVVHPLLGVLDNFDLALKQDPSKATAEQILQGVTMIRQLLSQALASAGVTTIEPKPGDEFDPHRHEAVTHLPAPGVAPGRIAATFQVGYALNDRVLRPAKTSISREPEPGAGPH